MNKYIEETNSGLVHTYNRFPLVLDLSLIHIW